MLQGTGRVSDGLDGEDMPPSEEKHERRARAKSSSRRFAHARGCQIVGRGRQIGSRIWTWGHSGVQLATLG